MSKRTILAFLAIVLLFSSAAIAADKTKVLLLGGRGHDWRGFHEVTAALLEKTGDFELTLSDKLDDLKKETISKYDVVLFYGSGGNFTDEAQEKGVDQFVRDGGGLVGVHATDAFKQSDVYWQMLGGRFSGHGGGKFMMRIEDKKHPVMATLEDFEIQDETYRNAFHPEFKLQNLARMDRDKEQQSMVWHQTWGKGLIFNTTLGHGRPAWENPAFQKMLVRSLYWVVGEKIKDPPVQ